jgi:GntR family transcriptional regulator, transcriptional repressor for pyruvate dehydrogenase complex
MERPTVSAPADAALDEPPVVHSAGEARGAPSPFSSLPRANLWSTAVEQIRGLVDSGRLAPGDRLPGERDLCLQLGISRVSLREAIRVLESAGYLAVKPGRGTFVLAPPAPAAADPLAAWLREHDDLVRQLFELRLLVEPGVAALAAERHDGGTLAALAATIDELAAAAAADDLPRAIAADAGFHRALAGATGNAMVGELVPRMMQAIGEERRASLAVPGQLDRAVAGHRAILAAVRAHDGPAAEDAMRRHLRDALHYIDRWLRGSAECQVPGAE